MKYYGIQNEVKSYINRIQSEQGITVSPSVIKSINDRVDQELTSEEIRALLPVYEDNVIHSESEEYTI